MLRLRPFIAAALLSLLAIPAGAANLPLLSGSQYSEPSQVLATVNTVIQNINAGVSGLLSNSLAQFSTAAGTTEQTMFTYTLPPNGLAIGQSIDVRCWGSTGATANNKTRKLYYGAAVITTATEAANAQPWMLHYVVTRTASATEAFSGDGLAGTGGVTPLNTVTQGTDDGTAAVVIKCTGTDGTSAAGDILANGMVVQAIR